jgi:hypothetical protein
MLLGNTRRGRILADIVAVKHAAGQFLKLLRLDRLQKEYADFGGIRYLLE